MAYAIHIHTHAVVRNYRPGMVAERDLHLYHVADALPEGAPKYWHVTPDFARPMTEAERAEVDAAEARELRKSTFYKNKRYRIEVPLDKTNEAFPLSMLSLASATIATDVELIGGILYTIACCDNLLPDHRAAIDSRRDIFTIFDSTTE